MKHATEPNRLPLPPRIPGPPFIGNTLQVLRDPRAFFVEAYERYGPAFRVTAFGREYTILAGREAFSFFLTTGEQYFSRASFYRRFALELGTETFILGAQGAQHARLRRMIKLAFSRQVSSAFIPAMVEAVQREARSWRGGQRVNVMDSMAALSFEAYGHALANRSLKEYAGDTLRYACTSMRVGAMVRPAFYLYLPAYRRAKRRVRDLMRSLVAEHRSQGPDEHREFDILHALLSARDDEGRPFEESEVISAALYGFIGTLVYMNRVSSYLLYEVLKDPRLSKAVTEEADAAFANGPPGPQGLRRMTHLYSAYLETLRFHPVALGLPFCVEQAFEFHGFGLRKGQRVVISAVPTHFAPAAYSDPHRFDAGRCAAPRHEHHAPGAFAPFGFGGRVCAAVGLVEVITMVTLATLLRTVRLELEPTNYSVRTHVDPLPGPERAFAIRVVGQRPSPTAVSTPAPEAEEFVASALPGMAEPDLDRIMSLVKTLDYRSGETIIREGDPSEQFFIIMRGTVEVVKEVPNQGPRVLATLGPGEHFGEIGLLWGVNRTAAVRATSDSVQVLVLGREEFITMVAECDFVSERIAEVVRRRAMTTRLAATLPHLTLPQVAELLAGFALVRYVSGAEIVRQGDPADSFYIIMQGRVEVVNQRPGGGELTLAELGPGEWFGEMGLMQGRPRNATVRARSDVVQVMVADKQAFARLRAQSESTRNDLEKVLFDRLLSTPGPSAM